VFRAPLIWSAAPRRRFVTLGLPWRRHGCIALVLDFLLPALHIGESTLRNRARQALSHESESNLSHSTFPVASTGDWKVKTG
jgi:hypothetical protein